MKYNSRTKNIAANANTETPKINWTVVPYVSPPWYTGYNGGDDSTIFILELHKRHCSYRSQKVWLMPEYLKFPTKCTEKTH